MTCALLGLVLWYPTPGCTAADGSFQTYYLTSNMISASPKSCDPWLQLLAYIRDIECTQRVSGRRWRQGQCGGPAVTAHNVNFRGY
ncbi:hypothetical protein B0H14DRAFT_2933727 [Mycena olivaceomarginata]|nr:hypothetical protein B0H14DRAFT_2933727 [Mycena olivaceomarginata]